MRQVDDVVEDSEPEREQRRRRDADGEQTLKAPVHLSEDLSRFAYKSSSRIDTPPTAHPAPPPPARVVRKAPPDPQLVQLSKCVSCGLRWTSRKTAKQKRTHIEQCAKKNPLSKDTIKLLVEKEIAILSPTHSPMPANDPSKNATGTLMDSVVPAGPVKKLKRQQVVPSVRSLPDTRESILDRARDILGPPEGQADPQPTQQFGQSALARRNTQQPKRPALLDVNRSMEEPPPTQPFGTSSLRGRIMISERSADGCEESSLQQFGASMFAQDSVLSSDRHKRPASPSLAVGSDSRIVRPRLLQ